MEGENLLSLSSCFVSFEALNICIYSFFFKELESCMKRVLFKKAFVSFQAIKLPPPPPYHDGELRL